MRISDWSSDVCSSDLVLDTGWADGPAPATTGVLGNTRARSIVQWPVFGRLDRRSRVALRRSGTAGYRQRSASRRRRAFVCRCGCFGPDRLQSRRKPARYRRERSEEHTSELQSLMRISYAVFCLKKKINTDLSINAYYN